MKYSYIKTILLALLVLTVFTNRLYAQAEVDKTQFNEMKLPNDINPGGDLNLDIPLITVPSRDGLDYPINITYHSMTQPNIAPSWVGENWTLQVGAITRSVVNQVDDQRGAQFANNNCGGTFQLGNYIKYDGRLSSGTLDATDQYDQYYLNLPQGTMKLVPIEDNSAMYWSTYKTKFYPETMNGMDIDYTGQDHYIDLNGNLFESGYYSQWNDPSYIAQFIQNWRIRTPDGTLIDFGCQDYDHKGMDFTRIHSSMTGDGGSSLNFQGLTADFKYPTSWDIACIRSANYKAKSTNGHTFSDDDEGGWIKFDYNKITLNMATVPPSFKGIGTYTSVAFSVQDVNHYWHQGSFGIVPNGSTTYGGEYYVDFSYPNSIETPTHIAIFETSNRSDCYDQNGHYAQQLDAITLYRKLPGGVRAQVKRIVFSYNSNHRLLSIKQYGTDNNTAFPPYTFSYGPFSVTYPEGRNVSYQLENDLFSWYRSGYRDYLGAGDGYDAAGPVNFSTLYFANPRDAFNTTSGNYYFNQIHMDGSQRIKSVTITNAMGDPPTVLNYEYGEGVACNAVSGDDYFFAQNYGKWKSSSVIYRWIQVDYPDSSKRKVYFTSSLTPDYLPWDGIDANEPPVQSESYADQAWDYNSYARYISNAGLRGRIWKDQLIDNVGNIIKCIEDTIPSVNWLNFDFQETRNFYLNENTIFAHSDDQFVDGWIYKYYGQNYWSWNFYNQLNSPSTFMKMGQKVCRWRDPFKKTTIDGVVRSDYPGIDIPSMYQFSNAIKTKENGVYPYDGYQKITYLAYNNSYGVENDTMTEKYMLTQPFMEVETIGSARVNSAIKYTWKDFGNYHWRVDSMCIWREPLNASYNDGCQYPEAYDINFVLRKRVENYDIFGNELVILDGNGARATKVWGYSNSKLIGEAKNSTGGVAHVDDFNDGNISDSDPFTWTTSGVWTCQNGILQSTNSAYAGNHNTQYQNFTVDVRMCIVNNYSNSSNWAAIHFGSTSTDVFGTGYLVYYRYNGEIDLFNQGTNLVAVSTGLAPSVWRRLTVSVNGTNVQVFIDGQRFINYTLSAPASPGYVSLYSYITDTQYDDFRCYPYGASMKSYAYDPITLQCTSFVDENNVPTYYIYDGLQRLSRIQDYAGDTVRQYSYHYLSNPSDPNYRMERQFRTSSDFTDITSFVDGLGREIQAQISTGSTNIISHKTFDAMMHLSKLYKPYAIATGNNYDPNFGTNCSTYYNNLGVNIGQYPFTTTLYQRDGLNRLASIKAPGTTFQDHYQQFSYTTNFNYEVPEFPENELLKKNLIDENSNRSFEYSDAVGHLICKKQVCGTDTLVTRFHYNLHWVLDSVISPNGTTTTYLYNTTDKSIRQKTSPDAGTVKYLYDKNGNLRFTQDAKQAPNKFTYRKYDALNRVLEVGEYTGGGSFTQTWAETTTFPEQTDVNRTISQVFSYDDLTFSGQKNLKGHLARSISYRQGSAFDTTHYSYDAFGRVEWLVYSGLGSSLKQMKYWYDLQGNVTKKGFIDQGNSANNLYTFYEYDQAGRLARVYTGQNENGTGKVKDAEYTYYPSGQVMQLNLGQSPAQTIDYRYNERDWLTAINDVGNIGTKDKFAEELQYNSGTLVGSVPQFNGNIAALKILNMGIGTSPQLGYRFNYDAVNRLNAANTFMGTAWSSTTKYSLPQVTYDANGNILSLYRNNQTGNALDRFTYKYVAGSNRLDSLTNKASGTQKYRYLYDANGNDTTDNYHGLSRIKYNIQNLPEQIIKSNGNIVYYWYDANGNRIRKQESGTVSNDEIYILGADGQTEAVFDNQSGNLKFWNILAGGQIIGRVEK